MERYRDIAVIFILGVAAVIGGIFIANAGRHDDADHGDRTGVAYASIPVNCKGGKSFTLAARGKNSKCFVSTTGSDQVVTGATCSDDEGNSAEVSCGINGGEGGCKATTKEGECTPK